MALLIAEGADRYVTLLLPPFFCCPSRHFERSCFVFHIRASRIAGQCTSAHLPRVMLLSLFCEHGSICSFAYSHSKFDMVLLLFVAYCFLYQMGLYVYALFWYRMQKTAKKGFFYEYSGTRVDDDMFDRCFANGEPHWTYPLRMQNVLSNTRPILTGTCTQILKASRWKP